MSAHGFVYLMVHVSYAGEGRSEPIPLEIKTGRGGLGQDTDLKRKTQEMQRMRDAMAAKRQRVTETLQSDFKCRVTEKMKERETESDLNKSQKVCQHLDIEQVIADAITVLEINKTNLLEVLKSSTPITVVHYVWV